MLRLRRIIRRSLIVFVFGLVLFTLGKVELSAGYMYSSDNKLINCSEGFTVTSDGIYNILSTAWSGMVGDAGNTNASFNSPQDLALYKDPQTGEETIYIVDSESNKLFIFDGNLNYKQTINTFKIKTNSTLRPTRWTEDEVSLVRTRSADGKSSTYAWSSTNTFTGKEAIDVNLYGPSGVYRALRPVKDSNNKNVLDENEETVYQDILYICDSNNRQVLLCDVNNDYEVVQVVSAPAGYSFSDKYQPTKITTDSSGRMFIISNNIYEGILLMSYQGEFMRMVGVNYTTLSVWDAIKRNFKTEEQLAQETSILQTSFKNLCIDDQGFIYTVSGPVTNADGSVSKDKMIKRINQSNTDVLKRTGYNKPIGDIIVRTTGTGAGASSFVGITVNQYGVYTVVDEKNCRLFTYDEAGYLLYISGGAGSQVTDINIPVAIAYQGDDLLVLDRGNKAVMRFTPTDFAKQINQAVYYEYMGDADSAANEWQNVINSNPQYELGYVGVGKKYYEEGRYREAMTFFQKGNDAKYYSRAYKLYRDSVIKKYFPTVITVVLVGLAGWIVFKQVKKHKQKKANDDGDIL